MRMNRHSLLWERGWGSSDLFAVLRVVGERGVEVARRVKGGYRIPDEIHSPSWMVMKSMVVLAVQRRSCNHEGICPAGTGVIPLTGSGSGRRIKLT